MSAYHRIPAFPADRILSRHRCLRIACTCASQSARGRAQSKTLPRPPLRQKTRSVLDCGGVVQRPVTTFRNWVTADGAPGPTGSGGFKAEPGRYHLYVARACPWAHRTTIFREIKGLQSMIGLSVTHWLMADNGWTFEPGPGVVADPLHSTEFIWELYKRSDPNYTGHATVPVFWDKDTSQIVNNESAQIIRIFNSAFDDLGAALARLLPAICARRSTPTMPEYTTPSTTACTRPGLPDRSLSTMRRSAAS